MEKIELKMSSTVFGGLNEQIDETITECLKEIQKGNFASGTITVKIGIGIVEDVEVFPVMVGTVKAREETYHYQRPLISYKTDLSLKKSIKNSGKYSETSNELKKEDDIFLLVTVQKAQMSLDDTGV